MQNGHCESFNGKFRDECLNEHWFTSLRQARELVESWRANYAEFLREYPEAIPLFVVDGGKLTVVTVGAALVPQAGQTLVAIVDVPAAGGSAPD